MSESTALSRSICRQLIAAGIELPAGENFYCIERLYPGHWQRSSGAWSWRLRESGTRTVLSVGSQFPARMIAKGFVIYRHPHNYADIDLLPTAVSTTEEKS